MKKPPLPPANGDIRKKDILKYVNWGLKHGAFKGRSGRTKLYTLMMSLESKIKGAY
jgi:hypothetical protein